MGKLDFLAPPDLRLVGSRSTINGDPSFSLAALNTAKLPDGALVYVQSVRAYFQLQRGSTATPDGASVIAAYLGAGNWVRRASDFAGDSSWLDQTTWYIDANNGSDDNDGATAGTALASHAEFARRIGDNAVLDHQITVYILSDLNESLVMRIRTGGPVSGSTSSRLVYIGVPTAIVRSGTVQSYTAPNTGVEGALTDAGIADWTADRGKRITFTSGAALGCSTFCSSTATAGVGTARVGRPVKYSDPTYSPFTPAPGDTYDVETLPVVRGFYFDTEALDVEFGGPSQAQPVRLEGIAINPTNGAVLASIRNSFSAAYGSSQPRVYVGKCSLHELSLGLNGGLILAGCTGVNNVTGIGGTIRCEGHGSIALFNHCGGGMTFNGPNLHTVFGYFDRSAVYFDKGSNAEQSFNVGIWDAPGGSGAALTVYPGSIVRSASPWGNATTTTGIAVGGALYYPVTGVKPTLAGTVNDTLIGGTAKAYAAIPYIEPANNAMMVPEPP